MSTKRKLVIGLVVEGDFHGTFDSVELLLDDGGIQDLIKETNHDRRVMATITSATVEEVEYLPEEDDDEDLVEEEEET